jgi:hypothetical protein
MRTKTSSRKRLTTKTKLSSGSRLLGLLALALSLTADGAVAAQAVIAGTVFRPPGFALAGAEITVTLESELPKPHKFSKTKITANLRGEFAVRVPAVPASYRVDVQKDGFQPQSKSVAITGEERYDLSIVLEPVPSNK